MRAHVWSAAEKVRSGTLTALCGIGTGCCMMIFQRQYMLFMIFLSEGVSTLVYSVETKRNLVVM
jgi:hypothetical protein